MRQIFFILFIVIIQVLISCEKLIIERDQDNTHVNNFELLWSTIDRKYSFFEYKNVNWDSIKQVYETRIHNRLPNSQFFAIMSNMLLELRDGHVNLYSDFYTSKNYEWYSDDPLNFNSDLLENKYLSKDVIETGTFKATSLDSLGYIYIGSFSEKIRESDIDMIVEKFYGMKGIIIDVRNNSGGYSINGKLISSRFTDSDRLVSFTLYKTGPGHGDFSQPQPNYISPAGKKQFLKPVVLLTNRRTFSAANDFVLTMSALPNVTIVGDTTGGGGGTPYDYELLNGWVFRFPRTQTLGPDKFNIEHGIPPTIKVNLKKEDEYNGIDTIIETAINYLNASS